jgi:hypothetical protein
LKAVEHRFKLRLRRRAERSHRVNRRWAIAVGVVAVAAVVAIVLAVALDGGDAATERALSANLTTALIERSPTGVTFAGVAEQSPGGEGLVLGHLQLHGDLRKGKPVPLTCQMEFRFENGRVQAKMSGEARPQPDRTTDLVGRGTIESGTGEFEGAKGSFRFVSGQEPSNPTVGHPRIRGTIEY